MLMAPNSPIINRPVLQKRSHKRSPIYPNCTATTPMPTASKAATARSSPNAFGAHGIIECARVIDQPGGSGKFGQSDYNSEEKKSREQCVAPNDYKTNEQTIINKIKSCASPTTARTSVAKPRSR